MPSWLASLLALFGVGQGLIDQVGKIVAGFGTFLSTEAAKFFPSSSLSTDITSAINFAEGVVMDFDQGVTDFEKELIAIAPDITTLIGLFPWLPVQLMAITAVQKANPAASPSFVINTLQAAHANVRVASPAVQAQIASLVAANKKP